MEGDPPLEAEPIAQVTADPSIEVRVVVVIYPYSRLPAFGAIRMDELVCRTLVWLGDRLLYRRCRSFCRDVSPIHQHGIGKVESIAAQIQESRDSFDGAIRMHSAEHEMAGKKFHCNISVSLSRISPIMMTSGSARRKARMATAKVNPIFRSFHRRKPSCVISMGSSAVQIFRCSVLISPARNARSSSCPTRSAQRTE